MSLISENKVVPKLRFREFKDSWNKQCLKSKIHSIDSGWSPQCEAFEASHEEWGVLKTSSVVLEGFNQNANKKLPNNLEPKFNLQVVKGDILVTRAGPKNRVGIVAHVNKVRPKIMLSDKLIRLKVNNETSSLFTSISLSLNDIKKKLISKSSGLAVSQTNISQKILLNTKLFFPSYSEQQKIASFLSAVDEKIQQLTKKKEILEDYKKGIMQKIFSQEIRFKDNNGNEYPDWQEKKLGQIGKTFNGLTGKTKKDFGNGKPFIQYMQVFSCAKINTSKFGFVNLREDEKQNKVRYGDVFFTISSETPLEIGYASVLTEEVEELYLNSFCFGFRANSLSELYPDFSSYLLRSQSLRKQIVKLAQGSTRYNMSKVQLLKILVKLPSLKEQKKIAYLLNSIDKKIEFVSHQLEKTKEFKKGLLQQMFV